MNQPQTRGRLASLMLLALIYAVSGRIALFLALPPSYATAVFPPAGIALAFVMIYGWRVLPGVFLGALILNVLLDLSRGSPPSLHLAAPLVIAFGSTVQVAAGRIFYRRLAEGGARFDSVRSLAGFLLGAPVLCLVSATLSLAGLWLIGAESMHAIEADFLTWWVGDTLGVVLCVPLTLLFIGQPGDLWKRRRVPVGVPVLIGMGLCVACYLKTTEWENAQSLQGFQLATGRAADALQTHLTNQEFVVGELAAFMGQTGEGGVTRDAFHRFGSATLAGMPEVAALEWAPCVTDAGRSAFEAGQARAVPGFRIVERTAGGAIVPAARRNRYFPVTYAEPMAGNRMALGFDLGADGVRDAAIEQALASGRAIATSPIELIQERQKQPGLILVQAVHAGSTCSDLVLSAIRLGDFVRKSLPAGASALDLRIDDMDARQTVFGQATASTDSHQLTYQLHFGGRAYLLVATPTKAYLAAHRSWESLSLLAGCLFGTSLLGALMLLSTGYTERTKTMVRDRTAQFERESRKMTMFLRNASDGIHIVDAQGRLFEVSESFCKMLGYTRDELIGMRVDERGYAGTRPEEVEATILACLESNQTVTFEAQHQRKDGSTFNAEVSVCAVDLQGARYLFGSSRDITERKLAEQALRQSESRLHSITDRIPMRVAYIDNRERYRFVNLAFEETYGIRRAEVNGMTIRQFHGESTYAWLAPYVARALAGETLTADREVMTPEGYRCERATCVPQFDDDGTTVLGFVAIVFDATAQKLEERRLIELSRLDNLTGLLNRAEFRRRAFEAIERSYESKVLMAVMALDIDGFKQINDTLGHQVGDLLLKGVASRLLKNLGTADLVARPGGDEFAAVVEGLTDVDDAATIAGNLVEAIREPFLLEGIAVRISVSIGVVVYAGRSRIGGRDLIKHADDLLYEMKRAGRNGFRVGMTERASDSQDMCTSL